MTTANRLTIAELAERIHDETGWTGKQLESAVHFAAMLYADATGHKAIGDYFQARMREAAERDA